MPAYDSDSLALNHISSTHNRLTSKSQAPIFQVFILQITTQNSLKHSQYLTMADTERAHKRRKHNPGFEQSQGQRASQMSRSSSYPSTSQLSQTPQFQPKPSPLSLKREDALAALDISIAQILSSHGYTSASKLAQTEMSRLVEDCNTPRSRDGYLMPLC